MSSPSNRLTLRAPEQTLTQVLAQVDSGEPDRVLAFEKLLPEPEGLSVREAQDWRHTNWGTTHTPGVIRFEHELDERDPLPGERTLLGTTDNGVMLPFLAALASRFPELEIELLYQDYSGGYAGKSTFAGGRPVDAWETRDPELAKTFFREEWPEALEEWQMYDEE